MNIVNANNLTKKFNNFIAVDNISFQIEKGNIIGFLGANGAGKTTTIKMMCGLLAPTSGELKVLGITPIVNPELIKKRIGYMSQIFSMYPDLTVLENLRFYGGIYGLPNKLLEERIKEVFQKLELNNYKDMLAGKLPLGFKQRLGLASASLHKPEIIFLDEPTSGTDPLTRVRFWSYVQELSRDLGITIIITTHFLQEAEYCDYIILMDEGKIAIQGSPSVLKKNISEHIRIFQIETKAPLRSLISYKNLPYILDIYSWGQDFRISFQRKKIDISIDLKDIIRKFNVPIIKIEEIQPSLEDIFIYLKFKHNEKINLSHN